MGGIEKNILYQELIKKTIKNCVIEYLDDDYAREYLNGKIDNLIKLEKTRDDLKKDNEITGITTLAISTLENKRKKITDELPENASILKNKKTQNTPTS